MDECAESETNLCSEICVNTPGSYSCSCPKGYNLGRDNISCNGLYHILRAMIKPLACMQEGYGICSMYVCVCMCVCVSVCLCVSTIVT